LHKIFPWFLGGSADLGPSNKTTFTYAGAGDFQADSPEGKNLHFGIREHAMAATGNGLALSKLRPFGATFFIFSDYARPSIRLASLMELPSLFVFTHDAMGDGEDGPTHQPIEHLISLRAIPGLITLRPGDANEVVEAYRFIMQCATSPRCWRCRVSLYQLSIATSMLRRQASRREPTCWQTLQAEIPK
jgi:transketolase